MTKSQLMMAKGYEEMGEINLAIESEFMVSKAEQQVINKIKGDMQHDK